MAKEYTQQEKDNIAVVHRWLDLYNNDTPSGSFAKSTRPIRS